MSSYRLIILGASLLFLLGIFRGPNPIAPFLELTKSHDVLKRSIEITKAKADRISSEIKRIEENPEYARKVLKDKYHITDENESIVFFAD